MQMTTRRGPAAGSAVRPASRAVPRLLAVLWMAVALPPTVAGLGYWGTPLEDRPYSAAHEIWASTGVVGHSLGYLGSIMVVVGVGMYSLRKRWRALSGLGRIATWLQVHIFLCTLGPYLVLLHTGFRFRGVAAVSFWAMAVVVASGVFGRYVYVRLPREVNGRIRSLEEVRAAQEEAVGRMRSAGGALGDRVDAMVGDAPAAQASAVRALLGAPGADLRRRRRLRRLRRLLEAEGIPVPERADLVRLADEGLRLRQQIAVLAPFQRLFRYWHVFHLPVAGVMLIMLAVHVTVAFLFGYGWPF